MNKRKECGKKCFVCLKNVDLNKDHYVLLGTYNRSSSLDEECYFHFNCWVKWFMGKVSDRSRIQVQNMQKMAIGLTQHPLIKSALTQIRGGDQILNMLNTPLTPSKINYVKKIADKIQDDRRKIDGKQKLQSRKRMGKK